MESTILANLIKNETYTRKVIPFIKPEYFNNAAERIVFNKISTYVNEYKNIPNQNALLIEVKNDQTIVESDYNSTIELIESFRHEDTNYDNEWLIDKTEEFCQQKAVYNSIMESIQIIDGKNKTKTKDSLPSILSDALSVSFDNTIGHDFLDDYEERYDFMHRVEERIPGS